MKIAVTTCTRDRLAYTQHCYQALVDGAGCDFDWYVVDNGSTDGTQEWLRAQTDATVSYQDKNLGIAKALNLMFKAMFDPAEYDVVCKFDNDLELTQPNTLRDLCETVLETDWMLSPRILGLLNPPQPTRETFVGGELLLDVPQIGGICLAAPAWVFDTYRYPSDLPTWGLDDVHICQWFRQQGGSCGYVKRLEANHYEGTATQRDRFPEYWERKQVEMGIA